ncbi:MAG: TatD family hydrolase [Bacteroides sp.]|nr:TatD family hydrolase [Bacteroides sp.]MCM1085878.1 TatD family hydrolase [Bacteroides sp.]
MNWIDTHTHTYEPAEGQDAASVLVERALGAGVCKQIMGGVDLHSVEPIMELCRAYPDAVYPTIGLHPTEVREDYRQNLDILYRHLSSDAADKTSPNPRYVAVGEIGIDLYQDKTYFREQQDAFRIQLRWAKDLNLPVVLHVRNAFEEAWHILKEAQDGGLHGVFHCYSGSVEQSARVLDLGFMFGIGGVLTFKNAGLPEVVKNVPLSSLVLETDAPWLAPVPYRGKPNESAYIPIIGHKLAEILGKTPQEIAEATTANACGLFGL